MQGQIPYLLQAVTWAKKFGLKVIVDLHGKLCSTVAICEKVLMGNPIGAPGSQNGYVSTLINRGTPF